MEKVDLEFAKIVATPTSTSWSQVYNAGNLFAVLSLTTTSLSEEEDDLLNVAGKKVFETLEKEYFALEEKNLASIKEAVGQACQKIPEGILGCLVVGAIIEAKNDILYVFSFGAGKVVIKRGEKIGAILDLDTNIESLTCASGFLEDGDLIILKTKQFTEVISESELAAALDSLPPSEIAETLSPKIHEKEEGGASAIVLRVKKNLVSQSLEDVIQKEDGGEQIPQQEEVSPKKILPWELTLTKTKNYLNFLKQNVSHPRKVFLTVALILLLVFVLSIFFAVKKKEEIKTQALFQEIVIPAQKKYEEGQALLGLNKNLAREDLLQAQKILTEGKSKFKSNSKEEKQISDLLAKVNKNLEEISPEKIAATLDKTKIIISVKNGSGQEGVAGKASDFLKGKGYNVSSIANADNYNYTGVTIKVKSSTSAYLNLLKKDLAEKYTVSNTSSDLSKDFTADAIVIIGK